MLIFKKTPCNNCLVQACCSKTCDKLVKWDNRWMKFLDNPSISIPFVFFTCVTLISCFIVTYPFLNKEERKELLTLDEEYTDYYY